MPPEELEYTYDETQLTPVGPHEFADPADEPEGFLARALLVHYPRFRHFGSFTTPEGERVELLQLRQSMIIAFLDPYGTLGFRPFDSSIHPDLGINVSRDAAQHRIDFDPGTPSVSTARKTGSTMHTPYPRQVNTRPPELNQFPHLLELALRHPPQTKISRFRRQILLSGGWSSEKLRQQYEEPQPQEPPTLPLEGEPHYPPRDESQIPWEK